MKSRRYFQLVERESSEVSLKWKVLHTALFVGIAINSTFTSHAISNLLNAFNCRCILYAKPVFVIDKIGHFNKTESFQKTGESYTETTTEIVTTETTGYTTIEPVTSVNPSDEMKPKQPFDSEPTIFFSKSRRDNETVKDMSNLDSLTMIPETENYFILNQTVLFKNDSMYGEINIKMAKTDSPYLPMCEFVRFLPLCSLVVSSVFAAVIIIYGKGGRGYPGDTIQQGWRHVYIVLIISVLLCVLFLIGTNLTNSGTQEFCGYFSTFTGTTGCNSYIDYFTLRTKLEHAHFYSDYILAYYSFMINTCLWTAQMVLILWRILSIADFKFYNIIVKIKKGEDEEDVQEENEIEKKEFQKIHQILKAKEIGTKEDPNTPDDETEEESDQNTESTARV